MVIEHRDVGTRRDVFVQKIAVILRIDHMRRSDHDIGLVDALQDIDVVKITFDVRVVNVVFLVPVGEKDLELAALGVDVIMRARV